VHLKKGFAFRVSTAFVSLAVASLAAGVMLGSLAEPLDSTKIDLPSVITLFAVFPLMTLCASVSSLIYLVWQRRVQHLVELAISLGLLGWLFTWEAI
jgi:hypothetical protein